MLQLIAIKKNRKVSHLQTCTDTVYIICLPIKTGIVYCSNGNMDEWFCTTSKLFSYMTAEKQHLGCSFVVTHSVRIDIWHMGSSSNAVYKLLSTHVRYCFTAIYNSVNNDMQSVWGHIHRPDLRFSNYQIKLSQWNSLLLGLNPRSQRSKPGAKDHVF